MDTQHTTASATIAATADLAITERIGALTVELSALMGKHAHGRWSAIVAADNAIRFVPNSRLQNGTTDDFLAQASNSAVIEYHLSQLTLAMRKRTPGYWVAKLEEDGLSARIACDPDIDQDEAWISFGVPS